MTVRRPTHFLTLHPGACGGADAAFSKAIAKFLKLLRRHCLNKELEYLVVNEWKRGRRHAHALVRVAGHLSRRAVLEVKRAAGLRCSAKPVRTVVGVANYIVKHTRNRKKKAEPTPADFRGRMYAVSKRFLTKPFEALWREVQEERSPRRPSPVSDLGRAGRENASQLTPVMKRPLGRDEGVRPRTTMASGEVTSTPYDTQARSRSDGEAVGRDPSRDRGHRPTGGRRRKGCHE